MMRGTLYGIGVGPGDPEWITVKAARVALAIARPYLNPGAAIHPLAFPMTTDPSVLESRWREAAEAVAAILRGGDDCCFLTLGDALFYSTYGYLVRGLRAIDPETPIVTIPGITAFSAAAALTNFTIGEGKQPVTIVPAADDLAPFGDALDRGGTVVLMKVGRRLEKVLDLIEGRGLVDRAVFVAHAGMAQQHVETDLRRLRGLPEEAGYLSLVMVHAAERRPPPATPSPLEVRDL
jgi:precorrin-2/cobalt-factor-2 C20-methyltransferase